MYPVSARFKTEMKKAHRVEHVRGTVAGVSFTDENVISLNYSNRCSDTNDVIFGSAYIGQVSAAFTGLNVEWGGWRGRSLVLEYGLEFPDQSIEWIPIGTFTIQKAEWTDISISIVASDIVADLDKTFAIDTTTGSIYDLLNLGCVEAGVQFGRTQAEIEALPNGSGEIFGLYPQNDIKTIRDYFSWIAQLSGGFITASRDNKVVMRSFSESQIVDELPAANRIVGSVFSDYSTYYDGISYVDIPNKATRYVSAGTGDGAVINLGSNPFLQYGTGETLSRQLLAIANVAHSIEYTPFTITILNNPVYDLGDVIECTGGVAGSQNLRCCIMGIDWTFKQTTQLEGYGADPSLSTAKSKTDKALDGLISQTSKDELANYTFVNASEMILPENREVTILSIRFATVAPKVVDFWAEIDLDTDFGTDPDMIAVEAHYYLDDELITAYKPESSWNNDEMHLMHLLYFLESLEGGKNYKFEIRLLMTKGSAHIGVEKIHANLRGQGLVSTDSWDGFLEVTDEFTPLDQYGQQIISFSDEADAELFDYDDISASDTFELTQYGQQQITFSDDADAVLLTPTYSLITEDGQNNVTTEDGDPIITEGDY